MANTDSDNKPSLGIEWSMKVSGDQLAIDYAITNRTGARIWVFDRLIASGVLDPDAVVVRDASEPQTVAFTKALVRTYVKTLTIPPPVARPLDPGKTIRGSASTPLPLAAYLNYAHVKPLAGGATHAILEIGYTDNPSDAAVESRKLHDGTEVTVAAPASMGSQKLLRGERKPLPAAAR